MLTPFQSTFMVALAAGAMGATVVMSQESRPTGAEAQLLAPGIISTEQGREFGACLSADGRTIYFTRDADIYVSHQVDGQWSEAQPVPFNSTVFDGDPALTHDGDTMYFMSERRDSGDTTAEEQPANHWVVRRDHKGVWGEPEIIPPPVSSDAMDGYASLTDDGTMYFFSQRRGGYDLYRSRLRDGRHLPPEFLGPPLSTDAGDYHPFIAPDESFMIFSSDRPGGYGDCDLYITFRDGETWTTPENLGPALNTELCDMTPFLTRDRTRLYFARFSREGPRDLYVIEFADLLKSIRRESKR